MTNAQSFANARLAELRATLAGGGIHTWRHAPTGIVIKVFAVSGGAFTRVDVRDSAGKLFVERSETFQFSSRAEAAFLDLVQWLDDSAAEAQKEMAR